MQGCSGIEDELRQGETDLRTFAQARRGPADFKWNLIAAAYVANQLTQHQSAAFAQHLRSCVLCEQDVIARRRGENNPYLGDRGRSTCCYSRLMMAEDIARLVRELTLENKPPVRGAPGPIPAKSPASETSHAV
jgi:hypothetical protein